MTGKVLLINHGAALLTDTLISNLKAADIEVVQVEPNLERIRAEKNDTDIFVLFAGDYVYKANDLLLYLKDICFGGEKILCAVGYTEELAEIEGTIPKSMIDREFVRPIDVKGLSMALQNFINANAGQKKEKHILLVDDDTIFLKMMQKWLGKKYRITIVRSGMQALTYIAARVPDLILLDYDMPITPGPQVLEMIRSEPKSAKLPVIFLTGKSDRESVMSVMHLNPDGYLLKSMSREKIMAAVDHFFEAKKWENPK